METPSMMLPDFGKNPVEFLKEVRTELKKVIWPTKQEAIKMTLTVVAVSIFVGVYIGTLDSIFTKLFEKLIK